MNPHSSDEDDDAPEAVSLSQSKKLIQQQNSSIRKFENAQKEKKRAKNRERDRKLKEQAQGRKKGKGKEAVEEDEDEDEDEGNSGDEGDNDAIARMRRAMKDAEEESDEDMDDDVEMHVEEDEDEEADESDEEEEEFHGFDAPRKSNHLPDHLFASAAASVPSTEKKTKTKSLKEAEKTRKRKKSTSNKAKDRVLGSRIIRALPDPNKPPSGTPSMVPTAKIRKFLDRSLSLRKTDKRVGGWERRAANIGSMKINHGPAAHFVRQQS
ncbi:uncharacterized protein EV420DRAFT_1643619 [Desarmillaria tabescens]|uniref:Uncharacterized protein n=1 Tax=Armillaria tabescens TaxID=1929756 RepID=A0AA39KAU9_ARMTA|nr:uncharacterized protein EV420DRAFT_1643619 [Desarmillaria tabescens]KAK0457762.1 hypothetical protein EV420DRAFT_1643619 [Desarmillaria tabescens]